MRSTVTAIACLSIVLVSLFHVAVSSFAEPSEVAKNKVDREKNSGATKNAQKKQSAGKRLVTVEAARERAKLTHHIYASTLEAMHHHYFNSDRSSVPARVMEDMFADLARQENIKAKWIAVNAKVMSIDHKPEGEFEKQAAKEIAAGKYEYERLEKGLYRRAVAIPLTNNGCLGCHMGFAANNNKRDRFAGLVISIPVKLD